MATSAIGDLQSHCSPTSLYSQVPGARTSTLSEREKFNLLKELFYFSTQSLYIRLCKHQLHDIIFAPLENTENTHSHFLDSCKQQSFCLKSGKHIFPIKTQLEVSNSFSPFTISHLLFPFRICSWQCTGSKFNAFLTLSQKLATFGVDIRLTG